MMIDELTQGIVKKVDINHPLNRHFNDYSTVKIH